MGTGLLCFASASPTRSQAFFFEFLFEFQFEFLFDFPLAQHRARILSPRSHLIIMANRRAARKAYATANAVVAAPSAPSAPPGSAAAATCAARETSVARAPCAAAPQLHAALPASHLRALSRKALV